MQSSVGSHFRSSAKALTGSTKTSGHALSKEVRLKIPAALQQVHIYKWTSNPSDSGEPGYITIGFGEGIPLTLDEEHLSGVELISTLNTFAGQHGVGRTDMMEDRVLGLKAREIYEHPAATVISVAHKDLEALVLTRQERKFKEHVDSTWSELTYYGLDG